MPRVDLTPDAQNDLKEIWDYVARDSQVQADRLLRRFAEKFEHLTVHRGYGRPRPELAKGCRSHPFGSYCFYFRQTEEGILRLRVLHSARDIRQIEFPKAP
ncbi:MAG: type II toxin-antitoxin system RelE/ParE family toxin [Verrucomicrobiaceae bacterium]|nr:type II toxin-antitoxin system RelE/ParE family toxin [Verrucomicrobiaceae bacterium]